MFMTTIKNRHLENYMNRDLQKKQTFRKIKGTGV